MAYDSRKTRADASDDAVPQPITTPFDLLEFVYGRLPEAYVEHIPEFRTYSEMTRAVVGILGNSRDHLVASRSLTGLANLTYEGMLKKGPLEVLKRCKGHQGCDCVATVISIPDRERNLTVHLVVPQELPIQPAPGLTHTTVKGLLNAKVFG